MRLVLLLGVLIAVSGAPTRLLVGLAQPRGGLETMDRKFWSVSDPDSAEYGQHVSVDQLAQMVGATTQTVERATLWLESLNASTPTLLRTRDALVADLPSPPASGRAPAVPESLSDVIDYVLLLTEARPAMVPKRSVERNLKANDEGMGLAAQMKAYGVPSDLEGNHPANLQMVWGTGTFGFEHDDLDLFYSTYCPKCNISAVSFDKANVWAGKTGKNFVEGTLDVSYISGVTRNVRTLVANTNISASTEAGEDFGAALLSFLTMLAQRETDLPLVLSMSLGSLSFSSCDRLCKAADKQGHAYKDCWDYLQTQFQACMFSSEVERARIDVELQKLGLRGVTVLAASGDGGSHFAFGPFSEGSLASTLNDIVCKEMNLPVYPADSPYVLSVGGTEWQGDMYGPGCSPSKPCGWEGGGGGFSWAPMPESTFSYQSATTPAYLAEARKFKVMSPEGTFNATGRGYPDVSALAAFGIPLCDYGGCSGSGGTSASAPTVGGLISLINDQRLKAGLPSLGFLNPRLYKLMADPAVYEECFADPGVTKADPMWDCQHYCTCTGCDSGFPAVPGWDAQTGFGQPKFPGLLKHLGSD